jgi:hypothetical protein
MGAVEPAEGPHMPRSHPERRRFPRFPLNNPLLLKTEGGYAPGVTAYTLDVSAGGCKLVHDSPIAAGSNVDLVISAGGRSIRASGRVVYDLPLRSARFQAGVEFLRLDLGNRAALEALLRERAAPEPA